MKNEPKDNNPTREDLDSLQKSLNLDLKSLNLQNKKIILLLVGVLLLVSAVVIISKEKKQKSQPITQTYVPAQENAETVTLTKNGFIPDIVKIKTGTRVIWLNRSGEAATINSDPHPTHDLFPILKDIGEFEDEASVQVLIDMPGTYTYHNHLNPTQKGSIVAE